MAKISEELYTAGKVAKLYGIAISDVKKVIKESRIKADAVKGGCSYYSKTTAEKIRRVASKQ
jgi:hypothetical protein